MPVPQCRTRRLRPTFLRGPQLCCKCPAGGSIRSRRSCCLIRTQGCGRRGHKCVRIHLPQLPPRRRRLRQFPRHRRRAHTFLQYFVPQILSILYFKNSLIETKESDIPIAPISLWGVKASLNDLS